MSDVFIDKEFTNSVEAEKENQTQVTFCHPLRRSCGVENACSSKLPGTTAEQRAHYYQQLQISSVRRPVIRLNTTSFYYFGKRIANNGFLDDLFSRNLPFSFTYGKTAWRNLSERQEFNAASLSNFPDYFWS
ncbi:hypothetical protein TNCV_2908921 [Trichonephila clavipes]|nr:hypothetical protein TNCV_2908921 [Trichonephila clavipes]